jgi:hypothetical protein
VVVMVVVRVAVAVAVAVRVVVVSVLLVLALRITVAVAVAVVRAVALSCQFGLERSGAQALLLLSATLASQPRLLLQSQSQQSRFVTARRQRFCTLNGRHKSRSGKLALERVRPAQRCELGHTLLGREHLGQISLVALADTRRLRRGQNVHEGRQFLLLAAALTASLKITIVLIRLKKKQRAATIKARQEATAAM